MLGSFKAKPRVEWLTNGDIQLLEPFTFVDANQYSWTIPAGAVLNANRIPKTLWSTYGPPYMGPYRQSSLIYHYFIHEKLKTETYPDIYPIEKVFYNAALVEGCEPLIAVELFVALSMANWWIKKFGLNGLEFFQSDFNRQTQKYHCAFQDFCMLHANELTSDSVDDIHNRLINYLKRMVLT